MNVKPGRQSQPEEESEVGPRSTCWPASPPGAQAASFCETKQSQTEGTGVTSWRQRKGTSGAHPSSLACGAQRGAGGPLRGQGWRP